MKCCLQNYCKNDVKWTGACFTKYIFLWTDILYCWKDIAETLASIRDMTDIDEMKGYILKII